MILLYDTSESAKHTPARPLLILPRTPMWRQPEGRKKIMNNTQNNDGPRGCFSRLVERLFVARAQMAPHQRDRDNGKLILDCCEYLGGLELSIDHIEEQLMNGARIVNQEGKWHLFAIDGDGLKTRDSLAELITDIPPLNV